MSEIPEPRVIENPDGSKLIISFKIEGGKKLKITQKVKEITITEKVNKSIAERRKWAKFGAESNSPPGPNLSTTKLGEELYLRLAPSWKEVKTQDEKEKEKEKQDGEKSFYVCRTCGIPGHFTAKCPFKEILGEMGTPSESEAAVDAATDSAATPATMGSGKYVPPTRRVGGRDPSSDAYKDQRERDDAMTLKISQLNENADEVTIKQKLLSPFPNIPRISLVRNKETGKSRGVAYVTFVSEQEAETALRLLDGRGFMNLILHAEWSKPKVK
ncbi:HFL207Wp [Eremothecium sinecaudum]|uniref:Eukaryotic translation initiation factor 3 subunit G n=1 Tax=Eremothecium sinecaudum TaxID=45286 RepID=A0A0X8HUD9_9SACH|nr:HFL207Wp [Eremothecium sinecaudum]AMD21649.1 HFL207Wp [Eremothecium sinecaudum]